MKINIVQNDFIRRFIDEEKKNILSERVEHFLKKLDLTVGFLSSEVRKANNKKFNFHKTKIYESLNSIFAEASILEKVVKDRMFLARLKRLFRSTITTVAYRSKLIKHGTVKPKGFPGDFKIVEAMYNNKPLSKGIGVIFDQYFLQNDYVQAVRDRKDQMKFFLEGFFKKQSKEKIFVVNLACGSCREIRELQNKIGFTGKKIIFTLIDQDKEAIDFAKKKLRKNDKFIKYDFRQSDVLRFFNKFSKFGRVHLIYSIGLIDYLPDSILGPLLKRSFESLKKGGEIIIAHKNTKKYKFTISSWGSDWSFIPRNVKDIRILIESVLPGGNYLTKLLPSNNKHIFYLAIIKK